MKKFLTILCSSIALFASECTIEDGYHNWKFESNGEAFFLKKALRYKKSLLFDVGANKGQWSFHLLNLAPSATIIAFEPSPAAYKSFSTKIMKQKKYKQHISVFNIALSDGKEQTSTLFCYDDTDSHPVASELNSLYDRETLREDHNMVPKKVIVELSSMDDFCLKHNIKHIDYLKIDTEGNEYKVLLGAEEMLNNKQIDIAQFEYGGTYIDSNITLEAIYHFLSKKGYTIFRISPTRLIPIERWDPSLENYAYCNYVAISPNYLADIEDVSSWIFFE